MRVLGLETFGPQATSSLALVTRHGITFKKISFNLNCSMANNGINNP